LLYSIVPLRPRHLLLRPKLRGRLPTIQDDSADKQLNGSQIFGYHSPNGVEGFLAQLPDTTVALVHPLRIFVGGAPEGTGSMNIKWARVRKYSPGTYNFTVPSSNNSKQVSGFVFFRCNIFLF